MTDVTPFPEASSSPAGRAPAMGDDSAAATAGGPPRISVIVACLDAGRLIDHCLNSIAETNYPGVEIIVADGGSRDGTLETLRASRERLGGMLSWVSEPDSGIADAWNKAIAKASGDWLLFLGADDTLAAPNVFLRAARHLEHAAPRHRIVYGQVALVGHGGEILRLMDRPWSPREFRSCRYNLPHQAVFHHRSLFREFGDFDAGLRIVADFDFLLRHLMTAEPLYLPGLVVARMRVGGASTSTLLAPAGVREQIRLYRRHVGGISAVLTGALMKAWIKVALYHLGGDPLVFQVGKAYRSLTLRGQA
jgi:glycosyltransferase involved in cell wall biosynthesis